MPGGSAGTVLKSDPVDQWFAPDGPLAAKLSRYQPRSGQVALARAINGALETGSNLVAEAATGTGKTLAYLVPAILSEKRIILSTGTLNLQDQLFRRDLPLALRALDADVPVSLLKGRSNYLCLHRLEQHRRDPRFAEGETGADLERVHRWARTTRTGEMSELEDLPDRSPARPLVTSTVDNCLGKECPMYNDCHLVHARRAAQEARIVVANHHLLFADLALKKSGFGEVLPGSDAVVLDEAHQVPEVATRFFSSSVSAWQIRQLVSDSLAAAGQTEGALALVRDPVDALRESWHALRGHFHGLAERGPWKDLESLQEPLGKLAGRLDGLGEVLDAQAESSRDLANCAERALRMRQAMAELDRAGEDKVRWWTNRGGNFSLNLTPLSVAEPFRELREELPASWIFTSATLAVGDRFDHFNRALGLEEPETLIVDSPFDYPGQSLLWLPEDLPEPGNPAHTEKLLETVLPMLLAAGGRAFLLFTAHRTLNRAAKWLRQHCEFELLVQEEAPREVLIRRFREAPGRLLLGAASFWEGVDVPGDALSVVIIDKLPFAAPDDPVLSATLQALKEKGENPFSSIQLPRAVIALKQGAGRLIRSATDRGVLVLGDPRISSRSYGRLFLKSLPPMPRTRDGDRVLEFLKTCLGESRAGSGQSRTAGGHP